VRYRETERVDLDEIELLPQFALFADDLFIAVLVRHQSVGHSKQLHLREGLQDRDLSQEGHVLLSLSERGRYHEDLSEIREGSWEVEQREERLTRKERRSSDHRTHCVFARQVAALGAL
jgi:hypothetical protein